MYGHPVLVTDHARALAPSHRAFNRWFWKDAWQGVFPELLLPSPAPLAPLMDQVGGSLQVAVLFARQDSIYKSIPGCDVFDIDRDARTYTGDLPVVAHPPCRAWGRLRAFAKPRSDEKDLAFFAIDQIRRCGGVLEHPAQSSLWPVAGLPPCGAFKDAFGVWTLAVDQFWWGHRARKRTFLYICGIEPSHLPPLPLQLGDAPMTVSSSRRRASDGSRYRKEIPLAEREATPRGFALWLLDLASRCRKTDTDLDPLAISQQVAVSSTTATKSHG